MKIKKVFASILTLTILISSLSLPTFANAVINLNGTTPTYLGKNLDLNSWISYTSPSFNGVPDRVPGDEAFFSNKGEIKLKINDQNRSYFENGGSIYVYAPKAQSKLHVWGCNYEDWLSYKPESGMNSFKIDGPKQLSEFNRVAFLLLNTIFSIVNPANGFGSILACLTASCIVRYFTSWWIYGFLITPVACLTAPHLLKFINNLCLNLNINKVDFDYGIVLTDPKDELVLNPNLPKENEINEKAFSDLKKQKDKDTAIIQKFTPNPNLPIDNIFPKRIGFPFSSESVPVSCRYTKQDIDKMKKDIVEHKATTYNKLVNTVPINDGLVCKLDKEHPSQTFRFVINNQFPDNPHNADLFALALQNNNVNLAQTDTRVNFTAKYNAISPDSNVSDRLANVPLEIQQKINLINNIGTPGIFTKLENLFSNPIPAAGGAPGTGAPGGAAPRGAAPRGAAPRGAAPRGAAPVDPRLAMRENMLNDINGQFLNEAIYNYRHSQTQKNYNRMQAALDAFNNHSHLDTATANAIHNVYQGSIPAAPPAPLPPLPPQRPWYKFW